MEHILLIAVLSFATVAADPLPCVYPDELAGYRICEAARWRNLRPLESTASDVRAALGKPTAEHDLGAYLAPYPGDDEAHAPVLTFDGGPDWQILVYFVRTDAFATDRYPASLRDRVLSVDLLPRRPIPFGRVRFPASFTKAHVIAADAAWDDYRHPSGLVYSVYTSRTPHGDTVPGDLNRISYGVSDEARRTHAVKN